MDLDFRLHPAQAEIFNSPARFKVVAAGRRFGKSHLAHVMLITEALKTSMNGVDLTRGNINVAYVAPTFKQARTVMWSLLLNTLGDLTNSYSETDGVIRLPNGRKIYVSGSDNYDNLRGGSYSFLVLDEYAHMKPDVWTYVLRATLNDCRGGALFIGTPQGKNHFYELFLKAQHPVARDWEAFTYTSYANPYIEDDEIEDASQDVPAEIAAQEFRATFAAFGGMVIKDEWITELEEPPGPDGQLYMAVDLSGFDEKKKSYGRSLDDTAIAIVEAGSWGWYVHDIVTGRWDVRETAIRILRLAQQHRPTCIGIEKGSLKAAIQPYLVDNMKRLMVFPPIAEVSHGLKNKQARIQWALQGRLEQGRLTFKPGAYMKKFREQAADFPNSMAHDDMLDALAYIDQVAHVNYHEDQAVVDEFEPLDDVAGY